MPIRLKVPTIACEGCATTIINAIAQNLPAARAKVDVATKIVEIETEASESDIRSIITSIGHEPD